MRDLTGLVFNEVILWFVKDEVLFIRSFKHSDLADFRELHKRVLLEIINDELIGEGDEILSLNAFLAVEAVDIVF